MRKTIWTTLIPALVLASAGIFLSANLLSSHIGGKAGGLLSGMCSEESSSCGAVLASRWAVFPPAPPDSDVASVSAGGAPDEDVVPTQPSEADRGRTRWPVALLGLCYFCFMAVWLLFVGRPSWERRAWHVLPVALGVAGCAMSAWFIVIMRVYIGESCPLCMATHVLNFVLLAFVVLSWPMRPDAARSKRETQQPSRPHPSFRLASSTVVLAAAVCAAVWQFSNAATLRAENAALDDAYTDLRDDAELTTLRIMNQEKHDITIRPDDPIIPAKPGKRMTVVLFSDMQCSFCRPYEKKFFNEILPLFDGHLRVVYKHHPICRDCNRFVKQNPHPLACEAAYLAEAARLQGGSPAFWKFEQLLHIRTKPWTDEEIAEMAESVGLDAKRLLRDRHDAAVKARVREDIELGKSLGVTSTPALFLNGRRLDRHAMEAINFWQIIAENLKKLYAASANTASGEEHEN